MSLYIFLMALKNLSFIIMGVVIGVLISMVRFDRVQKTGKILFLAIASFIALFGILFSINITLPW